MNSEAPEPSDEMESVEYTELFAAWRPPATRLERTNAADVAIVELSELCEHEGWSATREARLRLAALSLVEEYVLQRKTIYGSLLLTDSARTNKGLMALGRIRSWLQNDLEGIEGLERDLEESGVQILPDVPGGGMISSGKPGPPSRLLTVEVRDLLKKRFSHWDGDAALEESNSDELRQWLSEQLGRAFDTPDDWAHSVPDWPERAAAYPFNPEDLDPRPHGLLWRILNNFRRLR